jgi:hypothetical protein
MPFSSHCRGFPMTVYSADALVVISARKKTAPSKVPPLQLVPSVSTTPWKTAALLTNGPGIIFVSVCAHQCSRKGL